MPQNNSLLETAEADLLEAADVVGKIYDGSQYIKVDNERDRISLKPNAITKVVGSDTVNVDETINEQGNTEYTIHANKLLQGSRYIEVDNENDTVSLKPDGISKLENSTTTYVTSRTDENGNISYKVNVNDDILSTSYTGENPIVVNNTTKTISVNKLPLIIDSPLKATVTPTDVTIGCDLPTYTFYNYNGGEIMSQSITTGDSDTVIPLWTYMDINANTLVNGTLMIEGFMYASQGYTPVVDDLVITLYKTDDDDIDTMIYKETKKMDAPRVNIGTIIVPFNFYFSSTDRTKHTNVRVRIKSSSNNYLSTTVKVYFDGYIAQLV